MHIPTYMYIYTHINQQYSWRVSQFMRQAPPRSTLAPAAVSGFNAMVGGGVLVCFNLGSWIKTYIYIYIYIYYPYGLKNGDLVI